MLLEIIILTALDAVIDYINITDKTDYYVKTSLLAGTGHPNGYIETILNYYKTCVYRSYQYIMKQIVRTEFTSKLPCDEDGVQPNTWWQ